MLKPAILYKDELLKKFAEYLYTDEFFYYAGYNNCNSLPSLELKDNTYDWAIINSNNEVIGYFAYQIWGDTAMNFGLYSFDRGNATIGIDVFRKMEELIKDNRRVEWRVISGNPVKRSYDRFCEKHSGNIVKLHQVCRDNHGDYHDEYIYEIVKQSTI